MLARFYKNNDNQSASCLLCAHQCIIASGHSGRCRVRVNQGGDLHSLNYGHILAANPDPIEKKPLFHFKPGHKSFSIALAGCNFSCDFCQNWQISQADPQALQQNAKKPIISPRQIIESAIYYNCQSISYTYTEPIIFWEYALDCMQLAKEAGLANVAVSNGFGSRDAWQAGKGLLQAANIDLKAFDQAFYQNVCKGRLEPVLDSLRQLKEQDVWLEVTTLIIPGLNDDPAQLRQLASFIANELSTDTPWHISAYHPAYQRNNQPTGQKELLLAFEEGQKAGLKHVYMGNLPALRGEDTLCPACKGHMVARNGFRVINNKLDGNKCSACGNTVAGIWQ